MSTTMLSNAKRYIELYRRKKDLEREVAAVKDELAAIGDGVAEMFIQEGLQNINLDGSTLYVSRDLHIGVKADHRTDAVLAAEVAGHLDLIALQPAKLTAFVRELLADAVERGETDFENYLPPWMHGMLHIHLAHRLNCRIGTASTLESERIEDAA